MIIRKAKLSDFEEWFKLEKEFIAHENRQTDFTATRCRIEKVGMKRYFTKLIYKRRNLFLVLEDKKGLQGFLEGVIESPSGLGFIYREKKIGYINNAYIKKRQRGKGYFSMLMKEFYMFLKEHKVKHCALHVNKNNPAVNAYKHWGYEIEEYKMYAKVR